MRTYQEVASIHLEEVLGKEEVPPSVMPQITQLTAVPCVESRN